MTGTNWDQNGDQEARLGALFQAYRAACPDPEPGANFMPALWARIEARENSATILSRMAKALVTFAVAASAVIGLIVSMQQQPALHLPSDSTYLEALSAEHKSHLEPLHFERIADLDQD